MSDDRAFVYPNNEMTSKKTVNESVPFLHHFPDNHFSRSLKKLYIFTDSCAAQIHNIW
jgi:hypothetical protein